MAFQEGRYYKGNRGVTRLKGGRSMIDIRKGGKGLIDCLMNGFKASQQEGHMAVSLEGRITEDC